MIATPRDREILELLYSGLSRKETCAKLGIAERTIKAHIWKMSIANGVDKRKYLPLIRLIYLYHKEQSCLRQC